MDRLMKKLGLLALCTGLSFAVHAVTPQAEAPAEQNVKIDSVVVTGARYASDIRHLPMSVAVVDRDHSSASRRIVQKIAAGRIWFYTKEEQSVKLSLIHI